MHTTLRDLGLETQPRKTFVGRIEKDFDFLGYHVTRTDLTVARPTLRRFLARARLWVLAACSL